MTGQSRSTVSARRTAPVERTDVGALVADLVSKGRASSAARLEPLTGGVSSMVGLVVDGTDRWVAKTPLARLSVADPWEVDRTRGRNEATVLELLAGRVGPLRTPLLRLFEPSEMVLGMEWLGDASGAVPPTFKGELLAGRVDLTVAEVVGAGMAALHRIAPPHPLTGEGPRALFDALRLDPYYRTCAGRLPALASAFGELVVDTMDASPHRLVHGDFNPKNVLVGQDVALIDWEVVHCGDPAFDLGMMSAHLALKSLRGLGGAERRRFGAALTALWGAYDGPAPVDRALRHTGAIMLARLHGKSPVEYLTDPSWRAAAHAVGAGALVGAARGPDDLVEAVERAVKGRQPWAS